MKKFIYIILCFLILLGIVWLSVGTGTLSNVFMNKSKFEKLVNAFESEEREKRQKPDQVIELLGNIEGKTIMDIGAGTGYFAFRMSAKGAKVISADVDDRFINYVKEKKDSLNDNLIITRKVEYDDPLLTNEELHHAIIVNTYHHINNREEYFAKVAKGLKNAGSLMVVDFKKDVGGPGPPKRYRVSTDKVQEELQAAGFSKITINDSLLENFYVVIAEKSS